MKKNAPSMSTLVLGVILGLSMGCARKPDDAKISSEIQGKFSQDSGLSSKQLSVQSANGVVTLVGTVDNAAQRDAASRQAASVEGVREVVNNLQVGTASAPAAAESSRQPASKAGVAEKTEPHAGKKPRKPSAGKDLNAGANSLTDANADQMNAANQAPPPQDNASPNGNPTTPPDDAVQTPPPPPAPPAPKQMIIDQGTQIAVRLIDPIDSEKNQAGDTFHATLNAALTSDGEQAVPAGVELTGHLVDVKSASKFAGQSVVVMQLDSLSYGGKTYGLQTDQYRKEGKARGKNTAEKVGGGAVLGGIIGALAGGGKGAAIGAAAGAGAGGGVQAASKSQQIKLPSETVLNFMLQAPITVVQAPGPDADRQKLSTSQ